MQDPLISQLEVIAPLLTSLPYRDDATLTYDVMSDAIVWSDEIPDIHASSLRMRDLWCLRPVLRYRTGLILGSPDTRFELHWNRALELFTHWPGFAKSRCAPTLRLQSEYNRLRAASGLF